MDKLKQVLVYKFWIAFGLALLLPFVGWFMGSSSAREAITKGEERVDKSFTDVEGAKEINQRWADGLTKINDTQEQGNEQAWGDLAAKQRALQTWPETVKAAVKKAGPSGEIQSAGLEEYRLVWGREIDRIHQIVKPVTKLEAGASNGGQQSKDAAETGMVDFNINVLPAQDVWDDLYPKTQDMRDGQEDIWMFEALLKAIARVNEGAENRSDAMVKQIVSIELLEGYGKSGQAAPSSSEESSSSGPDEGGVSGGSGQMAGMGQNRSRGGGSSSFDAKQYFKAVSGQRYIEETTQYRSRAFNLELRMDHRYVPELLVALANSPWPVEILRVSQSAKAVKASRRGSGGKGGGMGGAMKSSEADDAGGTDSGAFGGGENQSTGPGGSSGNRKKKKKTGPKSDPFVWSVGITGTLRIYRPRVSEAVSESAQPGTAGG